MQVTNEDIKNINTNELFNFLCRKQDLYDFLTTAWSLLSHSKRRPGHYSKKSVFYSALRHSGSSIQNIILSTNFPRKILLVQKQKAYAWSRAPFQVGQETA